MQIPIDKAIPHVPKVSIVLVCICPVDSPRTMVLLLGHNPNVSLNLFGILVISPVVNLKAPNISYKLSFDDIDRHLPPVGNM